MQKAIRRSHQPEKADFGLKMDPTDAVIHHHFPIELSHNYSLYDLYISR